jgi:hypothetical protein
MLKTMNHYVYTQTEGKQVLESIEYRNLAPLYCDEEMRICCSEKKKLQNGSIYDVWIEGPTGGVAVKGTVHTTVRNSAPAQAPIVAAPVVSTDKSKTKGRSFKRPEHPALRYRMIQALEEAKKMAKGSESSTQNHVTLAEKQSSQDLPAPPSSSEPTTSPEISASSESSTSSEPPSQPQGEIPNQPAPSETTSQPPSREVTSLIAHKIGRAYRRNRITNTTAYNFVTVPPSEVPSVRVVGSYKPVKTTMSVRSKEILHRARRRAPAQITIEPIPLVRRFDAKPYTPDPIQTASKHSRFRKEGVRKMEKPSIRYVAELSGRTKGRTRLISRYVQK